MGKRVNARAKACDISKKTREEVYERDSQKCIFCHMTHYAQANTHVIPRAKGGVGTSDNIVTACNPFSPNKCHTMLDDGPEDTRIEMFVRAVRYLIEKNPNWHIKNVKYSKWGELDHSKDDQYNLFMDLIWSPLPSDLETCYMIAHAD